MLLAWHFLPDDGMTRFQPRIPVIPGQTLTVSPPLQMCKKGLHASIHAIDALDYAPGAMVCRVECSGEILQDQMGNVCAENRKCLSMANATRALHTWACDVAEESLLAERSAGREPDARLWDAIRVKRLWIDGQATDREVTDAREAAKVLPRDLAWGAARGASGLIACVAARDAVRVADLGVAGTREWHNAWIAKSDQLEARLNLLF